MSNTDLEQIIETAKRDYKSHYWSNIEECYSYLKSRYRLHDETDRDTIISILGEWVQRHDRRRSCIDMFNDLGVYKWYSYYEDDGLHRILDKYRGLATV